MQQGTDSIVCSSHTQPQIFKSTSHKIVNQIPLQLRGILYVLCIKNFTWAEVELTLSEVPSRKLFVRQNRKQSTSESSFHCQKSEPSIKSLRLFSLT